jgi:O-antigen/teichoic acid export membrane protein
MIKEFSYVAFGQGIALVGALILIRVLTEYLPPEEYGYLALSLTFVGLVNQSIMGGITVGIGRFYTVAAQEKAIKSFFRDVKAVVVCGALVVLMLGALVVLALYLKTDTNWIPLVLVAIVFSILSAFNGVLNSIQSSARQRLPIAFHSALDAFLKITFVVFFIKIFGPNGTVVIGAYCLSLFFVIGSQFVTMSKSHEKESDGNNKSGEWIKKIWTFSWPFSIWGIFTWAQQSSDKWALEHFVTSSDVGQYAVLFQIGYTPIVLAVGIVSSYIGPILYQRSGSEKNQWRDIGVHNLTLKVAYITLLLTVVAYVTTFIMHGLIFELLVSFEYRVKSHLLPWMVLSGGLFAASQVLAMKFISEMRSKDLTMVKVVTAIFGTGLNVIGVIIAGLEGAVFGLLAFSLSNLLYMFILAGRKFSHKEKF